MMKQHCQLGQLFTSPLLMLSLLLLLQVFPLEAAKTTTSSPNNEDLNIRLNKQDTGLQVVNQTIVDNINGSISNEELFETTQPRSVNNQHKSTRGGRMLNLDLLAGDIGKEEVLAKERSLNGQRQSRLLRGDLVEGNGEQATKIDGRTKKSKSKKMEIKGFIPIISLENSKGGKQFDNPLESSSNESEDEDETTSTDDTQTMTQLASNYGGQTSIGHASFAPQQQQQQSENYQQQQQTQQLSHWQQVAPKFQDQQEIGRANRKLLGSSGILSGLAANQKRFVSSLVSPPSFVPQNHLQGPINQFQTASSPQFNEDCICVPFFQCKNGYLQESQMSKSQLQLMMMQHNNPSPYNVPPQTITSNIYQTPRALTNPNLNQNQQQPSNDLYYTNQPISSLMSQIEPQLSQTSNLNKVAITQQQQQGGDQRFVDDIYEQVKKNIENDKLEQQLLLQQQKLQSIYPSLDERSKGGSNQPEEASQNQSSGQQQQQRESDDLQERSLLKPLSLNLNKRSGGGQAKCGIMRTCCKIPPTLLSSQQQAFGPRGQHSARLNGLPSSPFNPMTMMTNNNYNQRPVAQPQYQILRPTTGQLSPGQLLTGLPSSQNDHQASNSALSTLIEPSVMTQYNGDQYNLQNNQFQAPQQQNQQTHQSRPIAGNFMSGKCGIRQTLGISGRVQNAQPQPGSESTAEFGEFPAHVAILKRISPGDSLFVCSATLISNQWVATAAHCVRKHRPDELKVRLGEWDVNRDDEFYPFVESNIREIIIHPDFQASSLINDIALMRMEITIDAQQMPHISPSCLATPDELFNGQRCWLTGWGKDAFGQGGSFQSVLKKVDLPVVGRQDCEFALRYQTKLGKFFRLHSSNICAGGERGKDACEGDGGAGLYCQEPETGLTKVVGLVSWGVGCGQKGVPGVYTNLANFYNWIENIVAASGEENLYQDRNGLPDNVFKNLISERSNAGLNETIQVGQNTTNSSNTPIEQVIVGNLDKQIP